MQPLISVGSPPKSIYGKHMMCLCVRENESERASAQVVYSSKCRQAATNNVYMGKP